MRHFPASPEQPPENEPTPWAWEEAKKPKDDEPAKKKPKEEKPKKQEKPADKKEAKPKPQPEKPVEKKPPKSANQEAAERQEKRTQLVERSLSLKKHYENSPIPRDPAVLAQLLVAEHVLALNHLLEKPPVGPHTPTPDELLAAFDHMGQLAEKLDNPTAETPPAVELAYQQVLQLAEAALAHDETIEDIRLANEQAAYDFLEAQETTQANSPDKSSAPIPQQLIHAIVRLRQQGMATHAATTLIHQTLSNPGGDGDYTPSPSTSTTVHAAPPSSPAEARQFHQPATQHEQRLIPNTRVPSLIAPLAVGAVVIARRSDTHTAPAAANLHAPYTTPANAAEALTPAGSSLKSHTANTSTAIPLSHPKALPESHVTFTPNTPPVTEQVPARNHTAAPEVTHAAPSRKLEHMPLQTLLSMATAVPLGYGLYLREAYEKGRLDKAGLVKVLKSRAKNRDYYMEYRKQAARHRLAQSPEARHATTATTSAAPAQPATLPLSREDAPPASSLHTPLSFAPSSAKTVQDLLRKPAETKPMWLVHIVWIGALVTAVILLAIAIIVALQPV